MRIESSVLSLSWIPSEAVTGLPKQVFEAGVTHYDEPLPDVVASLEEIEELRGAARFRFANRLAAWIEVDGGQIVEAGYSGGGLMGVTLVKVAGKRVGFQAVGLPDLQAEPERHGTHVRFVQTSGGRAPLPAPRTVRHPPFIQLRPPDVWTTLALTIRSDGSSSFEVVGASQFPRHWIYDDQGHLAAKAGLADFSEWYRSSFGKHTPWGDHDTKAYVTAVETALERRLSASIMRGGAKPAIRSVAAGKTLTEQGTPGGDLFLLLDGILDVVVDGEPVAEVGPGAILGERALLEGGQRTATLRALTKCRVAVASADQIDREALAELSAGHRREDGLAPST
ncbi:MAG TPA: cyclic nucleotide-binding domain-containing protein [Acidimicrobiia bacterium]|nr:cyclic nucleotide-binding domain-containing protein [Acidimicrobiia bacterium]